MKIIQHNDIFEFIPKIYKDNRGCFLEIYNETVSGWFQSSGISFVQENISVSKKGTIRGLHYQKKHPQGKLVTVIRGSAIDVAIDIRKDSKTFGKKYVFNLDDTKKSMLWIPPGYAHGFQSLFDETIFMYKVTEKYYANDQHSIDPFDTVLSIPWSKISIIMSSKDESSQTFSDFCKEIK
jgi:dTDP-4-dehydrorhamnose 3,5-epimerase